MVQNVKRSVVSVALMMAFVSARADEGRSAATATGDEPHRLASADVQPKPSTVDRDPGRESGGPVRVVRGGKDDGRRSDAAAIDAFNNQQRFLQEVWRAAP